MKFSHIILRGVCIYIHTYIQYYIRFIMNSRIICLVNAETVKKVAVSCSTMACARPCYYYYSDKFKCLCTFSLESFRA
jgi:hypothetical protein